MVTSYGEAAARRLDEHASKRDNRPWGWLWCQPGSAHWTFSTSAWTRTYPEGCRFVPVWRSAGENVDVLLEMLIQGAPDRVAELMQQSGVLQRIGYRQPDGDRIYMGAAPMEGDEWLFRLELPDST